MNKFVPYEKLSKKQKKALNDKKRGTWNGLDPVTRVKKSKKVYDRKKACKWDYDPLHAFLFVLLRTLSMRKRLLPKSKRRFVLAES